MDKRPTVPVAQPITSDLATGQTGFQAESAARTPDGGDDGTPAILKMFKNQSNMTRSFYITSMQKGGVACGRGMGSTMSSTILKSGGGGGRAGVVSQAGRRGRTARPEWMVSEALEFTLSGSDLVRDSNVISASLGTNHIALLTGMYD
jgi:hypothetical protein